MPTIWAAPDIDIAHLSTPSPSTAIGAKGGGEDGCIATTSALLNAVEDAGWAVRSRDPDDRRRHELHTTKAGDVALAELFRLALANEAHVRQALGADERTQLFALLDKVYAVCYPTVTDDDAA